jgi:hypothetical protein
MTGLEVKRKFNVPRRESNPWSSGLYNSTRYCLSPLSSAMLHKITDTYSVDNNSNDMSVTENTPGRQYAKSRKVAGSNPNEVTEFFNFTYFQPHYGPGVYSAYNRNVYHELLVKRGRRLRLTISPPSVTLLFRKCGILDLPQPYRHTRTVTRIVLLIFYFYSTYPGNY